METPVQRRFNIAVVGAGMVGLASAVNTQRRIPEAQVTIIADKFLTETTSDGAAGLFRPADHMAEVSPDKLRQWAKDSSDHFMKIAASADSGKFGIFPIFGYHVMSKETNPEYKDFVYNFRKISQEEMRKLNVNYRHGYAISTLIIEPGKYMPVLMREFQENGGQCQHRTLQSLEELVGNYDIVVNCSGLASRWLVNDPEVYTTRGQLVKIKAPWIQRFMYAEDSVHIIPRSGDVVIGGVRQREDYSTDIREKDKQEILEKCAKLVPSIKGAEILSDWSGLRPHRDPLRLEIENMKFGKGNLPVVHNYGHGPHGIALSWGTGVHAARLVRDCVEKLQLKHRL